MRSYRQVAYPESPPLLFILFLYLIWICYAPLGLTYPSLPRRTELNPSLETGGCIAVSF